VVEVMHEIGIDLSHQEPRLLTVDLAKGAVRAITMGCGDECPVLSVPVEDWGLPDPSGQPLEVVREIRDDIDGRVRSLVKQLNI
jgi:arsenate reductase